MAEDELRRAVHDRVDAYRPASTPAFDALQDRKRIQDRRRMATAAVALSVVALVGAGVAVPALTGGSDRLTVDIAGPATPTVTTSEPTKRYGIRYADSRTYDHERDKPLIDRCLALPGTTGSNPLYSMPPQYSTSVTGTDRIAAFKECLDGLPNLTVTESGPVVDASGAGERTFRVSADMDVTFRTDPAAYTARVEECLALPGVTGSSVQESYPATYELRSQDRDADAVAACLDVIPGADWVEITDNQAVRYDCDDILDGQQFAGLRLVEAQSYGSNADLCHLAPADKPTATATKDEPVLGKRVEVRHADGSLTVSDYAFTGPAGDPGDDGPLVVVTRTDPAVTVDIEAFIRKCVGTEKAGQADEYLGLSEDVATRTKPPESADTVRAVRIVGRDGVCSGRDDDLRRDRVNLLIVNGKVVWAGLF